MVNAQTPMVKWLSCLPSKQAARVRFPFGVCTLFSSLPVIRFEGWKPNFFAAMRCSVYIDNDTKSRFFYLGQAQMQMKGAKLKVPLGAPTEDSRTARYEARYDELSANELFILDTWTR